MQRFLKKAQRRNSLCIVDEGGSHPYINHACGGRLEEKKRSILTVSRVNGGNVPFPGFKETGLP